VFVFKNLLSVNSVSSFEFL